MFGLTPGCVLAIEAPALPPLIWNTMMSISAAGSSSSPPKRSASGTPIGAARHRLLDRGRHRAGDLAAIVAAVVAMLVVILIYDQFMFRPLVAWADRFRVDSEPSEDQPQSWALTVYRRSGIPGSADGAVRPDDALELPVAPAAFRGSARRAFAIPTTGVADFVWYCRPDALLVALWRLSYLTISSMPA